MHRIEWTETAVATVALVIRKHPRLIPGFRRRPLSAAIEQVIHDQ